MLVQNCWSRNNTSVISSLPSRIDKATAMASSVDKLFLVGCVRMI